MDTITYYLAGPMSGFPQFNFPKFERTATLLREAGYTVISPAELDSDAVREQALASPDGAHHEITGANTTGLAGESWGDMLARDVKIIADKCDGILLMDGWEESKGACLETFVSILCDNDIRRVGISDKDVLQVWEIDAGYVREVVASV